MMNRSKFLKSLGALFGGAALSPKVLAAEKSQDTTSDDPYRHVDFKYDEERQTWNAHYWPGPKVSHWLVDESGNILLPQGPTNRAQEPQELKVSLRSYEEKPKTWFLDPRQCELIYNAEGHPRIVRKEPTA